MRTLELFAGIGGLSAASTRLEIVHAVDINTDAAEVYRANFQSPYWIRELESMPVAWLEAQQADFWWMSPPCTPFTRRGNQRDIEDRRSRPLLHLMNAASMVRPKWIVLENVVGFESSQAFQLLQERWTAAGYSIQVLSFCPSSMGWPNRRPRIYVVANRLGIHVNWEMPFERRRLIEFIDPGCTTGSSPELWLDAELLERYLGAMDRVDAADEGAITACFASSYGKVITRAGSYLKTENGYRRFSPREVCRLMGFSDDFCFPANIPNARRWHLLGNSLSVPAVQAIIRSLLSSIV